MSKLNWGKRVYALLLVCAPTAIALPAQTFTTLQSFVSTDGLGGDPISPQWATSFTKLHSFDGKDSASPSAGLVQATDGNLYGTTTVGGADGYGSVFKIAPSGTLSTLHSFAGSPKDGANPQAGLIQATNGNLYGTTENGGSNGYGTVFKITPSGTLTTLYSFGSQSGDGVFPQVGLIQATDGNLYGTTGHGGSNGYGTVFKITPGGALTTVYSFCSQSGCKDGALPQTGLIQATDGNLYGTSNGGAHGDGTVFKITPGGRLTTLHSFDGTDGEVPGSALVQATGGNFYGTTAFGGAHGDGTVFKITPSGTLTTLHSFDGTDGTVPNGLLQATNGNFYGTTFSGANDSCYFIGSCGTVFEITPSGKLTTLHSFDSTDGANPNLLVQDTNGSFYQELRTPNSSRSSSTR